MDSIRYQESVVKRVPRYAAYRFDGNRGTGVGIAARTNGHSIYRAEYKTVEVQGVEIPGASYIEMTSVAGGTPPQIIIKDTWVVFTDGGQVEVLSEQEYEYIYRKATDND